MSAKNQPESGGKKECGHYDGERKVGHFDRRRRDFKGKRHFELSSRREKGEGGFMRHGMGGRRRNLQNQRNDGGGSTLKLNNIPDGMSIAKLRKFLCEKGIHEFHIKKISKGSGLISFVEDKERVVEKLGELRIQGRLLQIEVVDHKAENNTAETFTKPTCKKNGNKEKFSPESTKFPKNVKDAEAGFKEAIGLFVPDSYEIREGKLILVYSLGNDILEDLKGKLDMVAKISPDENLQENMFPSEIDDLKDVDGPNKGEEEKAGEEPMEEEDLQTVFASMDVRGRQKVIQRSKKISLGDFLITAKPKQGHIKKKKKHKTADSNAKDDAQIARTAGH